MEVRSIEGFDPFAGNGYMIVNGTESLIFKKEALPKLFELVKAFEQNLTAPRPKDCSPVGLGQTCPYCGSLSVEDVIRLLKTPGTSYSCADWKYGWPHKFYINGRKFYNKHLRLTSLELFSEFNLLSEKFFAISWTLEGYIAVPFMQKCGTV